MATRKKGSVRKGHGVTCNICGLNCGKGGALKKHVEGGHNVSYENDNTCFYGKTVKTIIADSWDDSFKTQNKDTVLVHVLVRRFVGDPGSRGATRTAHR